MTTVSVNCPPVSAADSVVEYPLHPEVSSRHATCVPPHPEYTDKTVSKLAVLQVLNVTVALTAGV